jgi:glycosyltransferase involved in cell wall biosynthesis
VTVAINGRFRRQELTGVQRVAGALAGRLRTPHREVVPPGGATGLTGHLWEQAMLPLAVRDDLLWSPANVGPIAVRRQVLTIHDTAVLDHPEWFKPNFVRAYRAIWSALVEKAAKLVTVSEFTRQRLNVHFRLPPASVEVVPNAAASGFAPASPERIAAVRQALGLGEAPYFVTLSTREPRKNLQLALSAWQRARGRLPAGATLALIGAEGSSDIFADSRLAMQTEGVRLLGRVGEAELPAVISGAHALIYPSLYEGFGLPVLEAMACGAPAVTTRLTSLREVGGEAARYVDPEDPEDLARTLIDIAGSEQLRAELSGKGLERASHYSWDKSAAQMDELFERLQ